MATRFLRFNCVTDYEYQMRDFFVGDIVLFGIKSFNCGRKWHDVATIKNQDEVDAYINNGRRFEFASYSSGNRIYSPKGYGRVIKKNSKGLTVELF